LTDITEKRYHENEHRQSEFSFDKLITGLFGKPIWKQCICYSRNINTIYL